MSYHLIKAGINLYAILKNLEDLIDLDATCQELIKDKKLSIQFLVKNGPKSWIKFENNQCSVGQGRIKNPSVILWYTSPEHLNKMFDGKGNPIPLKGYTKLGFLQNEFTQITKKLEYYLKPELVENPTDEYIKINTQFTLTVAAFSLSEISKYDKRAKLTASHMSDGNTQLKVLPDGPSVYITIKNGEITANKGIVENPDAIMEMQDYKKANDFLNGKSNSFKAIALGDVMIKGQIPMLDNLSLMLDKVNYYAQ
jgi:putative sterol carrier protein